MSRQRERGEDENEQEFSAVLGGEVVVHHQQQEDKNNAATKEGGVAEEEEVEATIKTFFPLSGEDFQSLTRISTRPFRNAEVRVVPKEGGGNVKTIASMAQVSDCGVNNILYAVDEHYSQSDDDDEDEDDNNKNKRKNNSNNRNRSGNAEWVDSTRRVCAVFEGEVVLAGLFSVALGLQLEVRKSSSSTSSSNSGGEVQVYLDPSKWRKMSRQNPSFGVFVSAPHASAGRRKVRPGQRVLTISAVEFVPAAAVVVRTTSSSKNVTENQTEEYNDDEKNERGKDDQVADKQKEKGEGEEEKAKKKSKAGRKKKQPKLSLIDSILLNASSSSSASSSSLQQQQELQSVNRNNYESFIDNLIHQCNSQIPCSKLFSSHSSTTTTGNQTQNKHQQHHQQQQQQHIFVGTGETSFSRIHPHVFASTIFPTTTVAASSSSSSSSASSSSAAAAGRAGGFLHKRSIPKKKLLAFCCVGMPQDEILNIVASKLQAVIAENEASSTWFQQQQQNQNQNNRIKTVSIEFSVVFFFDLPSLHAAPQNRVQSSFNELFNKLSNLLLSSSSSSSSSLMIGGNVVGLEFDVVVSCASRLVRSKMRFPHSDLLKLYVSEMRGRVDCLESSSHVIAMNPSTDGVSVAVINLFAESCGIPFSKLEKFSF